MKTRHHLRKCFICKDPIPHSNGRFCRICARIWIGMQQDRIKRVGAAVRAGKIKAAKHYKCVDCGRQAEHYDHRNYSKPFEIDPTCRVCNYARGPGKVGAKLMRNMREKAKAIKELNEAN